MTLCGPFSSTPRAEFSHATRKAALARSGGRCEGVINSAGERCPMLFNAANPPEFDHIREATDKGDNGLDNCQVLGAKCCHRPKTKAYVKRIRKADAQSLESKWLKPKSRWPRRPLSKPRYTPPAHDHDPDC